MKRFLTFLFLPAILVNLAMGEETTIAEHPFFKPILEGAWTEEGEMATPQGVAKGKSTFEAKTVLDGQWIQQDGSAKFGSIAWEWRWMFRLVKVAEDQQVVQARYIDTNGQVADYLGEVIAEGKALRLSRSIGEGAKNVITVSHQEGGARLVEVANVDASGKATLQYKALGRKDP